MRITLLGAIVSILPINSYVSAFFRLFRILQCHCFSYDLKSEEMVVGDKDVGDVGGGGGGQLRKAVGGKVCDGGDGDEEKNDKGGTRNRDNKKVVGKDGDEKVQEDVGGGVEEDGGGGEEMGVEGGEDGVGEDGIFIKRKNYQECNK